MDITFDPLKRAAALRERGLDFADVTELFVEPSYTVADERYDYPEPRFTTYGVIGGRLVMAAWTPTEDGMRVISMRKCNDREKRRFAARMG